jgi:hypothetical protein
MGGRRSQNVTIRWRAGRGIVIDLKLTGDAHPGLGQTKQHSTARWADMA